jgi:thiol-disulfide isomerase/thioredoxin
MNNFRSFLIAITACLFSASTEAQQVRPNITDPRLDFTLVSLKGDSIRLSSLKGKVFLLDFWAAWCGPCRVANRHLVKLYSKYKDKGFEILGVSMDEEKTAWKKAVAKDKITWLQVNGGGGWDMSAAIKWGIEALPTSFLVDKNGDVVAINLEKKELETKVTELLDLKK